MKKFYSILSLYLFSALFSFAYAAACTNPTWNDPQPAQDVTYYSITTGDDQNSLTEQCQVSSPATTFDCATCGGDLATRTVGILGIQACNATYCGPVEVGALPADPTPVVPAPVQGWTVL